ncbi:tyrosine-type recombinase/integrase [Kitasatospora sp. NPDC059571]|uniref:tyrosine-type recombinase/integrase n=1 Tax=Kitasatospora sp. NPDC059571 TaxID=3346871 RepID=UPI0036A22BF0
MPTAVQLPVETLLTVRAAADMYLASLGSLSTVRSYGVAVGKTVQWLGSGQLLAEVADDEIREALELLWGTAAANTWNARRAALLSWLSWCKECGYEGPTVPAWAKRLTPPDSNTPARSRHEIDRLIRRQGVHLREKALWRMLYETAARAEEILSVNIEDLDLAGRRGQVRTVGTQSVSHHWDRAREDFTVETVTWCGGAATLLRRLLEGRTRGPVFVAHRRPGPGKVVGPRDICPDTERARLSYGRARALLDEHTGVRGPGSGWDLHELRHSSLTHLGGAGASLPMLMEKSRHKNVQNVRRYYKPVPVAEAATTLTSGGGR